jgi:hypothetical protein
MSVQSSRTQTTRFRDQVLRIAIPLVLAGGLGSRSPLAGLKPESIRVADGKKTEAYLRDGLFIGGDRAITQSIIRDIRRADNSQYERIVIDLEGSLGGEAAAIPRPPFFQASVTPDEKRIVLSIWGSPELRFDAPKVLSAFKKSKAISKVELLPKVEEQVWTFALNLKKEVRVEVFELGAPTRIILDIRSDSPKAVVSAGTEHSKATHADAKAAKNVAADHAVTGVHGVADQAPAVERRNASPQSVHLDPPPESPAHH